MTSPQTTQRGGKTHFASEHESSNEDPFAGPAFGGYPQVGLRPLNIDEGDEHDCGAHSGCADHPPHKLSESAVFLLAIVRCTIERRRGFTTEGVIDSFERGMYGVF